MEHYILLEEMRFFARHGVCEQERQVGNWFEVNLTISADFSRACYSDNISDTINYAEVYQLISEEMQQPSNLLEHVAGRIMDVLQSRFPTITKIELKLSKLHPPIHGEIEKASVLVIRKF